MTGATILQRLLATKDPETAFMFSAMSAGVLRTRANDAFQTRPETTPPAGQKLKLTKGQTIAADGERAISLFEVLDGVLMVYKLLSDGRRQIVELVPSGWLCGFAKDGRYDGSCEALTRATVMAYPRSDLEPDDATRRRLLRQVEEQVCALHDLTMTLGRKGAQEKVATFLMRLLPARGREACPGPSRPRDDAKLRIPLSRAEIADHLGLTLETVSREMNALARQGIIKVGPGRGEIVINDVCHLCTAARTGRNE